MQEIKLLRIMVNALLKKKYVADLPENNDLSMKGVMFYIHSQDTQQSTQTQKSKRTHAHHARTHTRK